MDDKMDILFYLSHGHGQFTAAGIKDPGAVSGKFKEYDINVKGCGYLREFLIENRGDMTYKVAYPERHGDGMHLWEHVEEIKAYRKKFRTVSFDWHMDSGEGIGCHCAIDSNNKYSRKLAELILEEQKAIGRPWHAWDGKMSSAIDVRDELIFLQAEGPVVLFEGGYIDNPKDRKDFDTDKEIKEMAEAIGRAMIRYYKLYN